MRAAIYTRISRDREGAGLGVDRQDADCRELADRLAWEIVETYSDNDISAYSGKPRPGYRRMLADIESGHIQGVIAWHSDRLHRRVTELEDFVTLCEKHGTAVQTVRSGSVDLSSASGRMVARMLGAAAQHEIDHARERMKRAKSQAAAEGRYRGGPRPFGYEPDGMTVRPSEAAMVLDASRSVLAGRSLAAIAREWNARDSTGTRGQEWNAPRVRKVLLRARNAGLVAVDDEVTVTAQWPAIVPEDVWRGVVGTLRDPGRRTNPGDSRVKWLGSGIYRCGVCSEPLRATKSNGRTVYRCQTTSHVSRQQSVVDEYVESMLKAYLSRPDVASALADAVKVDVSIEVEQITALRGRLLEFEDDYAQGNINGRQLREATERVESEIEALDKQIGARTRGNALADVGRTGAPAAAYESAPLDVRRAVLSELMTVTVHRGAKGRPKGWKPGEPYTDLSTVQIEWKGAP